MEKCEKIAAAQSSNRDVSKAAPGPKQTCSDVVNISIFFDGTGNNRFEDGDTIKKDENGKELPNPQKWSNVARLFHAAQHLVKIDEPNYAIYLTGVGTPYDESATSWADAKLMAYQDGKLGGMGAGAGGTRRTEQGHVGVNDALRKALSNSVAKLNLSLAPYVESGKPANIRELGKALEKHGLVTVINFSIFGFSRGAALARAFSNELLKQTTLGSDGIRRYQGMPVRFNFMGLFDTVASLGLPAQNIDFPFDERNLVVSPTIERCVHYIAAHELRYSFPVDSIRKNGKLQPNWVEKIYPGAHSDVGGGYGLKDQKISNNYARIPMRDMMREAVKSGVKLVDYDDLYQFDDVGFGPRYEVEADTLVSYNRYMAAIGSHATIEDAVTAHMKALYSAWGTMSRRNIPTPDLIDAAGRAKASKYVSHPGIAHEAKIHLSSSEFEKKLASTVGDIAPLIRPTKNAKYYAFVYPAKWRLEAWQATASEAVLHFIRHFVHDSKSGFIYALEPSSYFTARGMAESSRNITMQALDWLVDTATAVKNGVIKVYHRAEGVVVETWEAGKLVATRTYRVGEKFVVDTVKAGVTYTVEVYQSTKEVVIRTAKRGQQMVITSINTAKKHVSDAADATQKKASEVADATQKKAAEIAVATQRKATEVANATQKKVGELADATQRTAREVGTQIYDGASSAAKSVGQAVDSGIQAVEDGWTSARQALGF